MLNYLITGTNRGIGLELTKQLASDSNNLILACCRHTSTELSALAQDHKNIVIFENVDVLEKHSLYEFEQQLKNSHLIKKIDVLINNAGIWSESSLSNLNFDDMNKVLRVNAVGPLIMTDLLLKNNYLQAKSKLIFITSLMGSIADNTSGSRYSYRMSKAALNAACKSLTIDLAPQNIYVGIIHPGHLATDMGGPEGDPVSAAVTNIINRINELDENKSGQFFNADGELLPW